ncbi:hypothetical protein AB0J38_39720 [Streptomyces sp. NPDC050095]|uniref:hypothetical protein n=1 Tax=unclassified Streptomyces TaxID=2593676 RepID=UPI003446DDBD
MRTSLARASRPLVDEVVDRCDATAGDQASSAVRLEPCCGVGFRRLRRDMPLVEYGPAP